MMIFRKLFPKKESKITPDKPIGFGYKNGWLAIKSNDKREVAEFLKLKKVRKSNWKDGVHFGYHKGVFVTPTIDNWILALGVETHSADMNRVKEMLESTSRKFGES